uniref:sensor histidine kinase n=1 Tax=Gelidibacter sp. TaxID=2018083 RepID=UPI00404AC429
MTTSFKNRIAFHYMIATAIIMVVVFIVIYFAVKSVVYSNIDKDLSYEADKHTKEVFISGDSIKIINKGEWAEREHNTIQVNPVFVQIIDKNGRFMDKSPNLKEQILVFNKDEKYGGHFNETLNKQNIRQAQVALEENGKIKGYIIAAMSLDASKKVLSNLSMVLIISYLTLLSGLYFISRFLAARSIIPVKNIIETANRITKDNLNERVKLPANKDELYQLSSGINNLLQRIENTIARERQFTSDASHELRTPLASLRGTLEVLIRKPRTQSEYEEKVTYALYEIDRMNTIIEQLLILARMDINSIKTSEILSLETIVDDILKRYKDAIKTKNIQLKLDSQIDTNEEVPSYFSYLILDNVISNAIKYSNNDLVISILITKFSNQINCQITDTGIGIKTEDLDQIFQQFFRSEALGHKHISGNGLGLSIAKKAADAIGAKFLIKSELNRGTSVTITFLSKS